MSRDRHAQDDRRLHRAFAWYIKNNPDPDPEIAATDLLQLTRGNGWRPIPALQPPASSREGGGKPPEELRATLYAIRDRHREEAEGTP